MKSFIFLVTISLAIFRLSTAQEILTNDSIKTLLKQGISEEIILNMINTQASAFRLGADQVVELKGAGVSDKLLSAMIASGAPKRTVPSGGSRSSDPPIAVESPTSKSVRIPDGTPIRLRLVNDLTSATAKSNDVVVFELSEDLRVDGSIAVPATSPASGRVVVAEPKGRFGRSGKLDLSVEYLRLPDGTNVRLRAAIGKGKNQTITGAMLLGVSGLFLKGKDAVFPAGTLINAFIDGDRTVQVQDDRSKEGAK